MSLYLKLAVRNVFRNRRRTLINRWTAADYAALLGGQP